MWLHGVGWGQCETGCWHSGGGVDGLLVWGVSGAVWCWLGGVMVLFVSGGGVVVFFLWEKGGGRSFLGERGGGRYLRGGGAGGLVVSGSWEGADPAPRDGALVPVCVPAARRVDPV